MDSFFDIDLNNYFTEHNFAILLKFLIWMVIGLPVVHYSAKWVNAEWVGRLFGPLHNLLYRKYFFDELYENVIVRNVLLKGLFACFQLFDSRGVDGVVNGVANGVIVGGRTVR